MPRQLSELLEELISDAEVRSSFFRALDWQKDFGLITEEEKELMREGLRRSFRTLDNTAPFTARKNAVKAYIKEAKKNESMPAR